MILVLSFFPLVFGDAKRGWLKGDWKNHRAGLGLKQNEGMLWKIDIFFSQLGVLFLLNKMFFYIRIRIYIYTYYMYNCIYLSIHILYTEYLICSLSRGIMDWWDAIQLGGLSSQWLQPHNGCSHTTLTRTRIHVLESTSCFQSFGLFANNFHTDSRW